MSRRDDSKNLPKFGGPETFKIYNNTVEPKLPFIRPGTKIRRMPINLMLQHGGMGDYIAWTVAFRWMVKNCPWIDGRIWAPAYFIEFVRHFFDRVPGWKVFQIEDFHKLAEHGSLIRGSSDDKPQLVNATGASLIKIGFFYFANHDPTEAELAELYYPQLKLHAGHMPQELRGKEKKYAVFTPGGTTYARLVRGRHINPLIAHAKRLGLIPVVLGKHHLSDIHASYYDEGISWEGVLDLREKTTLLQAAAVMKNAAYTVGLDNGLLHLAACTDANIVAGYNIEHPSRRTLPRPVGRTQIVTLSRKELACVFCETHIKGVCYHNFKNCFHEAEDRKEAESKGLTYDSPKCIDMLFENDGQRFITAIERLLNEEKTDNDIKILRESLSAEAA